MAAVFGLQGRDLSVKEMYDRRRTKKLENMCKVCEGKYECLEKRIHSFPFFLLLTILTTVVASILAGFSVHQVSAEGSATPKYTIREVIRNDFDDMVKHREIRVLVVNSKTYFFLDRGKQRGITHDFLKEFEEFTNKKIQAKILKTHIIFIPVARDELIPGLLKGYGDIAAANLTITPERQKSVDFSEPLLTGVKEVVITGPAKPPISSLDDLAGKEVYVRKSSSYYQSLFELNRNFKKSGKQPVKLIFADENLEDEDLLEMVNADLIPMIIVDHHKAQFWQKIFDNIQVHADIAVRSGGGIAWAFRKNSPKLKSVINEFVKANKKGTLIGNMLFMKYLKDVKYVKNALSEKELQKYKNTVGFFKQYAGEYNFDYLMITAQAYQESGLDQSKKSRAGAVGIMQVLPSTAADPNVNIPEIQKLENNIHAGVKYLRYLVDQYYKDEPMSDGNKLLFAFAAYNAGPGNLIKIRQKTAEMGLDPNVWFYNVEIAAAKIIGRETVQYVSNIYKYYVAYKLIQEREDQKEKRAGK
jgi:membrane-bound lytic murein transglycosylase MltF